MYIRDSFIATKLLGFYEAEEDLLHLSEKYS